MFLSKRGSRYYLYYTDPETSRRQKISTRCTKKSDALRFLRSFTPRTAGGVRTAKVALSEFSSDYLGYSRSVHTPATTDTYADALRQFSRIIGDRPLAGVSVRDVERFVTVKKSEASAWTARKYFIALASVFETARRWGLLASNPFRETSRPQLPDYTPVFVTPSDAVELMKFIRDECFRQLLLIAFCTGLRSGELRYLRWEDVDLDRRVLVARSRGAFVTKTKHSRIVPLGAICVEAFRRLYAGRSTGYVFGDGLTPLSKDYVSKQLKRAVRAAGLDVHLRFHSLRQGFCAILVQQGRSLYEVQRLAGHTSPTTTQGYAHLLPESMHGVVEVIDRQLT